MSLFELEEIYELHIAAAASTYRFKKYWDGKRGSMDIFPKLFLPKEKFYGRAN